MPIKRGAVLATGLFALIPLSTGGPRIPRVVQFLTTTPVPIVYPNDTKEFYMTADEIAEVQPGFHITVNSITIPEDRRPVVDYSFTDDLGQPLDRNGVATPGSLSINQVLAWWDGGTRYYTAYTTRQQTSAPTSPNPGVTVTQASSDSGGTWTDHEIGHSTYRFKTVLPAGFDQTKTHSLAVYATRNTDDLIGKNYYANVVHDFRPDGGAVTEFWDKTVNGNCNDCHNPLSAHGGSRQDVKLCVTCHSPQTTDPDTGRSVNFREMVHKIHMGADLPSVQAGTPYVIWGNNSSIHDFSDVVFPKDIRNCETCHKMGDTPEQGGTQFFNYFVFPSRTACGSCHDNVNFVTGENHAAGPQADDSACAACHRPQGDREFDASILGAHTIPSESKQLKGLKAEILSVTNARPGQHPTVEFRLTENDGTVVAPSSLGSSLNLLMGGPTADYAAQPFREQAPGATVSGDKASYTFANAIPADATGTWAFSIEARRDVAVAFPPPGDDTIREAAFNPVHYENLGGGTPDPRRLVVDLAKCNTCHGRLAFHGGQRLNTQECVLCHNPNFTNDEDPAEGLDFKYLIHKIHRGEDLTQNYLDANHVRFPGDLRDCLTCHVNGTQQVPETQPAGRLPTQTPSDWYTPHQPTAAACLSCHDSQSTASHAQFNTSPSGEACFNCHGPNASLAVDKVHAQ